MTTPTPDWATGVNADVHNVPGGQTPQTPPISWAWLQATITFLIEVIVGRIAIALGGIDIAGWKPLDFLADWGQERIDEAQRNYLAATAADFNASTANANAGIGGGKGQWSLFQLGDMIGNALAGTAATLGTWIAGTIANANTALSNAGAALTQIGQMIYGAAVSTAAALGSLLAGAAANAQTALTNAASALNQLGQMITNAVAGTAATLGSWIAGAIANANTAVTNAGSALTQIGQMIEGAAAGTAATLGTWITNAWNGVQDTWNGIWGAVNGGTHIGKTAANAATAIASVNSNANTAVTNAGTATTTANGADLLATMAASANNLVPSPDFEESSIRRVDVNAGVSYTITYTSEQYRNGTQALKLVSKNANSGGNWGGIYLSAAKSDGSLPKISIAPGQIYNYDIMYFAKSTNTGTGMAVQVGFNMTDINGTIVAVGNASVAIPAKGSWQRLKSSYTVPATIPNNAEPIFMIPFFGIYGAVAVGDTFYIDRAVLYR